MSFYPLSIFAISLEYICWSGAPRESKAFIDSRSLGFLSSSIVRLASFERNVLLHEVICLMKSRHHSLSVGLSISSFVCERIKPRYGHPRFSSSQKSSKTLLLEYDKFEIRLITPTRKPANGCFVLSFSSSVGTGPPIFS